MTEELFKIGSVLKEGWRLTKKHLGFLIGYQVILYLLLIAFGGESKGFIAFLWNVLGLLVIASAKMGLYNSCLSIVDGITPTLEELYRHWKLLFNWIVTSFLFLLMVIIGLILFVFPAFYVLARFGLFPFFVIDRELGPIQALEAASKVTEGQRWNLFLLFLSCLGLNILGLLLLGIGLLFSIPITLTALAIVYRKLTSKDVNAELVVPEVLDDRKKDQ